MTKKGTVLLMPVFMTAFLLIWWVFAEKHSSYGSWHVYLALAIMPIVLIGHIGLIVWNRPRMPLAVYAVAHLIIFIPIWFYCLMQLSHDSL